MGTTTAAERKATERIHRQVMPGATGPNWSTPFVAPVNLPDHLADPDLSVGELTLKFMLQRLLQPVFVGHLYSPTTLPSRPNLIYAPKPVVDAKDRHEQSGPAVYRKRCQYSSQLGRHDVRFST
jgi:hypothetical protein